MSKKKKVTSKTRRTLESPEVEFAKIAAENDAKAERFRERKKAHKERLWDSYDWEMPRWLELHRWEQSEGLALILDCCPDNTRTGIPDFDELEDIWFIGFDELNDYSNLSDYSHKERQELDPDFIETMEFKRHLQTSINRQYKRLYRILDRNEPKHPQSPVEWIKFAKKYDVEVPWLDWAIDRGLIDPESLAEQESAIQRPEAVPQELNTNARNTYLVVIAALLKQMDIDYSRILAKRGKTSLAEEIEGYTEDIGARITHKTISTQILDLIEDAVEARHK